MLETYKVTYQTETGEHITHECGIETLDEARDIAYALDSEYGYPFFAVAVPDLNPDGTMFHSGNLRDDCQRAARLGVLRLAVSFDAGRHIREESRDRVLAPGGMLQFYEVSEPGEPCAIQHGTFFRHEYSMWQLKFADVMAFAQSLEAVIVFQDGEVG